MVVYIDIIFLINVLIDGTLIWMTGWSRKLRLRPWRLVLSAVIGGSYAVFFVFFRRLVLCTPLSPRWRFPSR